MLREAIAIRTEKRGTILPFEIERDIPFTIKRAFFLYDMPVGAIRGNHANMNGQCTLLLLSGEAHVTTWDGITETIDVMNKPGQYLFVDIGIWHKVENKRTDTVICVVASNSYDEADYESDYKEYLSGKVKSNV